MRPLRERAGGRPSRAHGRMQCLGIRKILQDAVHRAIPQRAQLPSVALVIGVAQRGAAASDKAVVQQHCARTRSERGVQAREELHAPRQRHMRKPEARKGGVERRHGGGRRVGIALHPVHMRAQAARTCHAQCLGDSVKAPHAARHGGDELRPVAGAAGDFQHLSTGKARGQPGLDGAQIALALALAVDRVVFLGAGSVVGTHFGAALPDVGIFHHGTGRESATPCSMVPKRLAPLIPFISMRSKSPGWR